MSSEVGVGILGIGTWVPENVRTNAWWPEDVVARWKHKLDTTLPRTLERKAKAETEGVRAALSAILELSHDPFQGGLERRVLPEALNSSDMEAAAARRALEAAEVQPGEIDLLLTYSMVPDYLTMNSAAVVHHKLGLPERCFVLHAEGICSSFLSQLTVAEQFIRAGGARRVLIVQSSCGSRVTPPEEPHSAWLGDGASAAVVGPVTPGHGILGMSHRVDGSYHSAFVCGVPGRRWYEEGKVVAYSPDPQRSHQMILNGPDQAKQGVGEALEGAKLDHVEIGFYACHQPSRWFRSVTQQCAGLHRAQSVDVYSHYASLGACNIPFQLEKGLQEGLVKTGDNLAFFAIASGMTWSSLVLRWGR